MTAANLQSGGDELASPALAVIRRRWWVIALTTVITTAAAGVGLSLMPPKYQATVTLQAPINSGVQTAAVDTTYADRLLNTYKGLAAQKSLRAEVARRLGRTKLPSLGVKIDTNTELLQLSASDRSATVAQRTANVAADVLVARTSGLAQSNSSAAEDALSAKLQALTNTIASAQRQLARAPTAAARSALQQSIRGTQADYNALVQQQAQLQLADTVHDQTLSIVEPASRPTSPAWPRWKPVLGLAIALGLLGGLALVFALERLRPRLYTVEAIEGAAEAEVMIAIPLVTGEQAGTHLYNGDSPAQEAISMLAIQVLAEAQQWAVRTIMVTSPGKGDGKSAVAANLAAELARSNRKVLLVDADMRAPSVHEIFGVDGTEGLSSLLEASQTDGTGANGARWASALEELIVPVEDVPNLSLLPAGPRPSAPARLVASNRLTILADTLSSPDSKRDFVVFDAPPLVVSDPLSVARSVDMVLLVVGGNAVPDTAIQAARRRLGSVGADHVFVVVNRWSDRDPAYSYTYR